MKTSLTIILLALMLLHAPTTNAGTNTYPPENAALLYYKAIASYNPDDDIESVIANVAAGKAPITEQAIKHIEAKKHIINDLITASKIEKCNWAIGAIEFRHGLERSSWHLMKVRSVSKLVLADAQVLASKGDYKTALERCVTVEKMAEHVSGQTLSQALIGFGMSMISQECMTHILGIMPPEKKYCLRLGHSLKHMKTGFKESKKDMNQKRAEQQR